MVDPLQAVGAVAGLAKVAASVSDEAKTANTLGLKVLGPPAEAIGNHLKARIEAWSEDALARRVLQRAEAKIDPTRSGRVPPRVAADIFEKAQWADDEFVAEYLSGVLASARTPVGKDDSAVSWTALVGRLSSDQLRAHYLLYTGLREKLVGQHFENIADYEQKRFLVSYDDLIPAFEWEQVTSYSAARLVEAIYGLEREGLIADASHGSRAFWEKFAQPRWKKEFPPGQGFFMFRAATAGTMLYLRAHGFASAATNLYVSPDATFEPAGEGAAQLRAPELYLVDDLAPLSA